MTLILLGWVASKQATVVALVRPTKCMEKPLWEISLVMSGVEEHLHKL